jgi:hypothetical protein
MFKLVGLNNQEAFQKSTPGYLATSRMDMFKRDSGRKRRREHILV